MKINLLASALSLGLLVGINTSWANTQTFNLKAHIDEAQSLYGNANPKYPILIFNQDEIDMAFLAADAFGDSKEKKERRLVVIQKYVAQKIGLELTRLEADQYEPYLTVLKGSAVALPVLNRGNRDQFYKMCAVFHASPNSNQRLEIERILGLKTPGVYDNDAAESINPKLSYETLAKFSLYHEVGHCLDETFLPSTYSSGGEDTHSVHESESFAEVMGLFILTQQGHQNIARTRGLLRTIYSRKMGRFFTQNPANGFGNPYYLAGGVIYYLDPVLLAGDEVIRSYRGKFSELSLSELMSLAKNIVKEHALNSRSFHAILRYLSEKNPNDALDQYRQYSYNSPDLFYQAYSDLIVYNDYTSNILTRALNSDASEALGEIELSSIDLRELCTLVLTTQSEALRVRLDEYRYELQLGLAAPSEQRERAKELNEIFEKKLSSCYSANQ